MAEFLTEKAWKDQLKKHKDVKDTGISEPLRDYEKYCEKDFLKAMAAIKKLLPKIETAKKDFKGNKDLVKYLTSMSDEAGEAQHDLETKIKGGDDTDGEEPGVDKDLATALRTAKNGQAYFAVIAKSASAGKLLLAKSKVPPAAVSAAKKELGGGETLRGICIGEKGTHVFYFRKAPPTTLAALIKRLAKEDAGMAITVECRVNAVLEDTGEADDMVAATTEKTGVGDGPQQTVSNQARAYETASAKWTQAKTTVQTSILALQKALFATGDQSAIAVVRGLQKVLGDLPDVGASLTRAANAAKGREPQVVRGAQVEAKNAISACVAYLSKNALVSDVEANPFVKVELKKPLGGVLAETTRACPELK